MHAAIYQKYLFLALIYRFELSIIKLNTNPPGYHTVPGGFFSAHTLFTRRLGIFLVVYNAFIMKS